MRIEPITPSQRAELEAALRPYALELDPDRPLSDRQMGRWLDALFDDPDRWLWWGLDPAGQRLGFVIFRRFRDWPDESRWVGSIAEFCIFPEHRRQGYGTALAHRALEALRAAGCDRVEAAVLWGRESSLGFWRSVGFGPVSVVTEREWPTPGIPRQD